MAAGPAWDRRIKRSHKNRSGYHTTTINCAAFNSRAIEQVVQASSINHSFDWDLKTKPPRSTSNCLPLSQPNHAFSVSSPRSPGTMNPPA